MATASGEVDVECTCPKCGHEFVEQDTYVEIEFELSDYALDAGR